jgi:Ca2+-binding EF-hand superfamily protein
MEIDKNDDNCLTKEDFVGINVMEQLISHIDKSKDGKITLDEFIAFVSKGK